MPKISPAITRTTPRKYECLLNAKKLIPAKDKQIIAEANNSNAARVLNKAFFTFV